MQTHTTVIRPEDLQRLQLFKGVDLATLEEQLAGCTVREIEAGETLIARGQRNDSLYLLITGRLRIYLDTMGEALTILEPGLGVGEISIIDKLPTTAHVVTETRSRLLVIPETVLWSMVTNSHGVAINMLSLLATRLRDSNSKLAESQERARKLGNIAAIDPLTGLFNQRWVEEELAERITVSREVEQDLSMVLLEADEMDQYVRLYGEDGADRVCYSLAEALLNDIRPVDTAVRLSERQLLALLPDTDISTAIQVAEDLRLVMKQTPVQTVDGYELPSVTVSAGVASVMADDTVESILARLQDALNKIQFGGTDMVGSGKEDAA